MASKRASLVNNPETSRSGERNSLTIEGKCQIGDGSVQEVLLTDLDTLGCMMRGSAIGVIKSDPLQLWLGEIGPIAGKLRWARHGSVGIEFDTPLYDDVIDQVRTFEPGPTVVALSRRSGR
ncbi:hypothetical protein [Altererythrobacter sp. Root672]|uniref:hypothetical protein n=1 Tax=Altererythrobacter sp. Root672 TaxID=1736584 RepID=UPI0006FEB200|nr:hypothetical protein [Altererythrobacter sp. Root672]KRA81211.1 hypothetical protein ASD76_11550 [Altererythrobacter sp. Root672]